MKKQAFLVKASVMTRVVIDVPDNFNEDTDVISNDMWENVVNVSIPRLKENIEFSHIEDVIPDFEVPYDEKYDAFEWGK